VIEKVPSGVIGHKQIGPSVTVVVSPNDTHTVKFVWVVHAGFLGYVFKSAVTAVAKKEVRFTFHFVWQLDENAFVSGRLPRGREMMGVGMNVARHE
jgi:hypothetical protein